MPSWLLPELTANREKSPNGHDILYLLLLKIPFGKAGQGSTLTVQTVLDYVFGRLDIAAIDISILLDSFKKHALSRSMQLEAVYLKTLLHLLLLKIPTGKVQH